MALYGRKVLSVGRCALSLLRPAMTTRQILTRVPSLVRRNWISLGISGGLCAVPFVQDKVSHEALIRRASSLVTDSANTFLSQTTLALVDSITQYTKTVHTLISLHKRYVASINKLSPADEDTVWQVIVRQREKLIKCREDCKQFEQNWMTAVNLSKLAVEVAFNSGADAASATAQTNLQIAETHVEQARRRFLEAEQELNDSKAEDSPRLQSTSPAVAGNEEEIPDAYLRED
ncbi:diablo, IAP-binding mitochondrial protein b [Clarias gariepinus]|uniref:diablo, IAP-binding mitochondrial protein b n=1 Tax=Clarias gariepinus TaxID=13013 RepID=UPI00234DF973|nr:diablo, IAP-binding mitochondrial protein b [Clarias gariepinus]